jgi:hypothetical protein
MGFNMNQMMREKEALRAFAGKINNIPRKFSKWDGSGLSPIRISITIKSYGEK